MQQALSNWLKKKDMDVDIAAANALCKRLKLDDDKTEGCIRLATDFELDRIDDKDFMMGLSILSGKHPEELAKIIKEKDEPQNKAQPATVDQSGTADTTQAPELRREEQPGAV